MSKDKNVGFDLENVNASFSQGDGDEQRSPERRRTRSASPNSRARPGEVGYELASPNKGVRPGEEKPTCPADQEGVAKGRGLAKDPPHAAPGWPSGRGAYGRGAYNIASYVPTVGRGKTTPDPDDSLYTNPPPVFPRYLVEEEVPEEDRGNNLNNLIKDALRRQSEGLASAHHPAVTDRRDKRE